MNNQTFSKIDRAEEQLNKIVKIFSSQEVVSTMSKVYLTAQGKPSQKWSFNNQLIQFIEGTEDARGYNQWKLVGRQVKKGSKAIYILAPNLVKIVKEDTDGALDQIQILRGFRGIPVFKVQDTEGEPVKEIKEECKLPRLADVAQRWGSIVKFVGSEHGEYGSYNGKTNEIRLSTQDEDVYFHELVHFAQQKIFGDLVSKSDEAKYNENEVVAQLGACVLANLYGIDVQGFTYQYIAEYIGNKKPEAVGKACVQVLSKVGKILNFILKTDEELNGGEKEVQ